MNRKLFYKEKGITMVSLVITIIILLILSSIALKTVIGENGLIEKSQQITKEYENTELREKEGIEELYDQLKIDGNSINENEETRRELLKRIEELEEEIENKNEELKNTGKMEKIKSGLLSNSQQKIDVTNIEGYQNLSVDNFILEFKEIVAYQKNDTTDTRQVKKTYDNEKGILTINKIQSWGYSSNGTGIQTNMYWTFYAKYDVYLLKK